VQSRQGDPVLGEARCDELIADEDAEYQRRGKDHDADDLGADRAEQVLGPRQAG
jgi:hypothetical protein